MLMLLWILGSYVLDLGGLRNQGEAQKIQATELGRLLVELVLKVEELEPVCLSRVSCIIIPTF